MEDVMGLTIRDPYVAHLAKKIASRDGTTMTAVVRKLLEKEDFNATKDLSISEKLSLLSKEALAMAKPGGHTMTKEEIDDLWTAE
jgi:antitoxin VapB